MALWAGSSMCEQCVSDPIWRVTIWLSSSLSTVEARVYLQSCGYKSEGIFGWEGFGFLCVFVPVTLKLGGLKVPSFFGIRDPLGPWTEPLSEHNYQDLYLLWLQFFFWARLLYQVCFLLIFLWVRSDLIIDLFMLIVNWLSRVLTLCYIDLLLYLKSCSLLSMIWIYRSVVVYDLKLVHHIDILLSDLSLKHYC